MTERPVRDRRLTIAVTLGVSTMAVLAFVATLFQTPGLGHDRVTGARPLG